MQPVRRVSCKNCDVQFNTEAELLQHRVTWEHRSRVAARAAADDIHVDPPHGQSPSSAFSGQPGPSSRDDGDSSGLVRRPLQAVRQVTRPSFPVQRLPRSGTAPYRLIAPDWRVPDRDDQSAAPSQGGQAGASGRGGPERASGREEQRGHRVGGPGQGRGLGQSIAPSQGGQDGAPSQGGQSRVLGQGGQDGAGVQSRVLGQGGQDGAGVQSRVLDQWGQSRVLDQGGQSRVPDQGGQSRVLDQGGQSRVPDQGGQEGVRGRGGQGRVPGRGGHQGRDMSRSLAPSQGGQDRAPGQGGHSRAPGQGGQDRAPGQGGQGRAPGQGGQDRAPGQGGVADQGNQVGGPSLWGTPVQGGQEGEPDLWSQTEAPGQGRALGRGSHWRSRGQGIHWRGRGGAPGQPFRNKSVGHTSHLPDPAMRDPRGHSQRQHKRMLNEIAAAPASPSIPHQQPYSRFKHVIKGDTALIPPESNSSVRHLDFHSHRGGRREVTVARGGHHMKRTSGTPHRVVSIPPDSSVPFNVETSGSATAPMAKQPPSDDVFIVISEIDNDLTDAEPKKMKPTVATRTSSIQTGGTDDFVTSTSTLPSVSNAKGDNIAPPRDVRGSVMSSPANIAIAAPPVSSLMANTSLPLSRTSVAVTSLQMIDSPTMPSVSSGKVDKDSLHTKSVVPTHQSNPQLHTVIHASSTPLAHPEISDMEVSSNTKTSADPGFGSGPGASSASIAEGESRVTSLEGGCSQGKLQTAAPATSSRLCSDLLSSPTPPPASSSTTQASTSLHIATAKGNVTVTMATCTSNSNTPATVTSGATRVVPASRQFPTSTSSSAVTAVKTTPSMPVLAAVKTAPSMPVPAQPLNSTTPLAATQGPLASTQGPLASTQGPLASRQVRSDVTFNPSVLPSSAVRPQHSVSRSETTGPQVPPIANPPSSDYDFDTTIAAMQNQLLAEVEKMHKLAPFLDQSQLPSRSAGVSKAPNPGIVRRTLPNSTLVSAPTRTNANSSMACEVTPPTGTTACHPAPFKMAAPVPSSGPSMTHAAPLPIAAGAVSVRPASSQGSTPSMVQTTRGAVGGNMWHYPAQAISSPRPPTHGHPTPQLNYTCTPRTVVQGPLYSQPCSQRPFQLQPTPECSGSGGATTTPCSGKSAALKVVLVMAPSVGTTQTAVSVTAVPSMVTTVCTPSRATALPRVPTSSVSQIPLLLPTSQIMSAPLSSATARDALMCTLRALTSFGTSSMASQQHSVSVGTSAPMTTSHMSAPMVTSQMSAPMVTSHMSAPMVTSQMSARMTTSHMSGPMVTSQMSAPMTTSQMSAPMVTSQMSAPMATSQMSAPMVTSQMSSPMATSQMSAPMATSQMSAPMTTSQMSAPMATSQMSAPMATSQMSAPMTTSQMSAPMATSQMSAPMVTSQMSARMTTSHMSGPMVTSQMSAPMTTSQMSAPMVTSQMSSPMVTSQMSAPMATSQMSAPMATSQMSAPMVTSQMSSPMATSQMSAPMATSQMSAPMATSQMSAPMTTSQMSAPMATSQMSAPMATSQMSAPMTTSQMSAPMATSQMSAPMATSQMSAPMVTSQMSAPMTTSQMSAPMATSQMSAPMTTSQMSAPMTTSQMSAPMVTSQMSAPMVTSQMSAPMTTSQMSAPMVTSQMSAPMVTSQMSAPMATSQMSSPMVTSQMSAPMATSQMSSPMATSQMSAPMVTSQMSAPMATSQMSAPMTTSQMSAPMVTSHMSAPMVTSQMSAPMTTSQMSSPMATSQMSAPMVTSQMSAPMVTSQMSAPMTTSQMSAPMATISEESTPVLVNIPLVASKLCVPMEVVTFEMTVPMEVVTSEMTVPMEVVTSEMTVPMEVATSELNVPKAVVSSEGHVPMVTSSPSVISEMFAPMVTSEVMATSEEYAPVDIQLDSITCISEERVQMMTLLPVATCVSRPTTQASTSVAAVLTSSPFWSAPMVPSHGITPSGTSSQISVSVATSQTVPLVPPHSTVPTSQNAVQTTSCPMTIEEYEDVGVASDDWSSKPLAGSTLFDEMSCSFVSSNNKACDKPVDPSSQQWCPEHYQLQKELARGLACSVQAVDATPSRKGAVGSASEADAEADAASISVNPAVKADLAESITVTRATSSSVPYLGPTFATEIKVLNDKEQLLQQRLVELQNKMGDLTKTITKKKNTVTTLRHQLELIRSQLEVEDTTLQDQIQQQEELLEKQDTLSREYHSVLMQKQELLFPGGSPLVRVKRKRSPSISPGISPPSSPTQSKKLRITPSLDQPNWQLEECPASGLTVAQFPAKKDGSPAGTGAGSEGMRTAMEHRAIMPKDIPDATPKGKLMEQEGRQNENLARNAGCDTGPAKPGDKPAEQNLVEQSPLLPNTGCVGSNGHVPSKPKDNLVPTVQPATLLLRIKEEKPNSPSTTHDAERAVVPSPEAREQGGGGRVGPVVSFTRHSASVLSLKMSGNKLFTCSSDKSVRVYNVQTGQILNSFTNHQKSVTCLELYDSTSGTSYLLSGSVDKTICMYNIETGVVNAQFKCGSRVMYMCVQRSLLFVGLSSAVVIAIDLEKKESVGKKVCHTGVKTEENPSISCLCANDDYLFTAAFDYKVHCWDIKDGLLSKFADPKFDSIPQVHVLSTFTNTVLCMKIHENHLYCGSADSSLQVHRIKTWEREHHITCHSGAVSGIQVLGKVLITACFDKYIRCFDLEKMELVQVYGGNTDMVFTVCVSKKMVYTGLKDGAVKACPIDLTVYYQCQWNKCKLRFGFSDHLSEHMKDHLGLPDDLSVQKCQWENCTQTLSTSAMLSHLHNHCAGVPSTKL